MSKKAVFLAALSILALFNLLFLEGLLFRTIFAFALTVTLIYFTATAGMEEKARRRYSQLKTAYEELDRQTARILRTDLELRRAQEELDKRIEGLYTLHELGQTINRSFNAEESFSHLTTSFISRLGFEKSLIMLFNETDQMGSRARIGYSEQEVEKICRFILQDPSLKGRLQEGKPIRVHLKEMPQEEIARLAAPLQKGDSLLVPLLLKKELSGFILVSKEASYEKVTEGEVELISILANQISQALENSSLYEELWRSHRELEQRIKERTGELARANEELKRLNQMKTDFVSNVSHELRTPLTSIKGFTSLLSDGKLGPTNEEQKRRLSRIDEQTNTLIKLVNDLLDISRIQSGGVAMAFQPVRIQQLLEGPLDLLQEQIREKKLEFKGDYPGETEIWVDREKMERVFLNLLGNAVKFTPAGGKITIQAVPRKGEVQFDITDTGIGMEPKDLGRIFEEFYRSENAIRQDIKGTGLGLSLVKQVIEAHQGKIWATSKLGQGSTFSVILPLKPKEKPKPEVKEEDDGGFEVIPAA